MEQISHVRKESISLHVPSLYIGETLKTGTRFASTASSVKFQVMQVNRMPAIKTVNVTVKSGSRF